MGCSTHRCQLWYAPSIKICRGLTIQLEVRLVWLCTHTPETAQDAMGQKNYSRINFRNPQGQFDNF